MFCPADALSWLRFAHDHAGWVLPLAVVTGAHAQKLTEGDVGLARVVERKRLGQILLREDARAQAVGNLVVKFVKHDAAGDAGEGLAGGGHVRIGVAMGPAEVFFEDEITVADDEQPAVLRAAFADVIGGLKLGDVETGKIANLLRVGERSPSPIAVGWGEIIVGAAGASCQGENQNGDADAAHQFGIRHGNVYRLRQAGLPGRQNAKKPGASSQEPEENCCEEAQKMQK